MFGFRKKHEKAYHERDGYPTKIYDRDIAKEVKARLNIIERMNILTVVETTFEVFCEKQAELWPD